MHSISKKENTSFSYSRIIDDTGKIVVIIILCTDNLLSYA